MPYKSKAQAAFMHINHPDIAARWDKEYYGGGKKVPNNRRKTFDRMLRNMRAPASSNSKPPQGRIHKASGSHKGPLPGNLQDSKPPYIQRDPLNDYQGHNLPGKPRPRPAIAPGEPNPNTGEIPKDYPKPRGEGNGPPTSVGMKRLRTLTDKNARNDKTGLKPFLRMYSRAAAGKNFGGKVFGENKGNTVDDFMKALKPYAQGSGYMKMLRQKTQGPPIIPGVKPTPRPRGNPGQTPPILDPKKAIARQRRQIPTY